MVSNHWTGLLDWTAGLDYWITGLNLSISHDFHPIKCHKFGYSNGTSSSHCTLGNVHKCTMHKLHGQMCIMYSWCVHAVSSKHPLTIASVQKSVKNTDKGLFTKNNVLPECHRERWCQMLYWLVVTRLWNYAWLARDLGIHYSANWPTKLLHLL